MSKRKIWILNRDKSLSSSKKSISRLKSNGSLSKAQWVLIPILQTSTTYIAVGADTILAQDFHDAEIRFRMQFKKLERADVHANHEFVERVVHNYYTTSIVVETIEELYNALYNILAFGYVKEACTTAEVYDEYWFIEVPDVRIKFFDNKNRCYETFEMHDCDKDEIPFEYDFTADSMSKLCRYFGIMKPDDCLARSNICFRNEHGVKTWFETNVPVPLFSTTTHILVAAPFTRGYVLLSNDEYDVALRINRASLFITPIAIWPDGPMDYPRNKLLPIAHFYDLDKYSFREWNGEEDVYNEPSTIIFHDFGPDALEIFSYDFHDTEDCIVMLEHIPYFLKVYHEGVKYWMVAEQRMQNSDDELPDNGDVGTVLFNAVLNLDQSGPAPVEDPDLIIYTDPYEDYLPNVKEVCYLLMLEEKSS